MLVVNSAYDDSQHEEAGHPECHGRVVAVREAIAGLELGSDLVVAEAHRATWSELRRVHAGSYLEELEEFCYAGGGGLDADTYATRASWDIAEEAAGAGLSVIRELQRREDGVGFVVARPPGHHASAHWAMGFCLLNNVAVAAAELIEQGERVVILDWDVHHGNGTQEIFWDEPNVLYVSTHESPLYPNTGWAREVGGPGAPGLTVNVPLPAGATGDVVRSAFEVVAGPVIETFKPTWMLVSAGFDAHRDDPLAEFQLTSGDFADLARYAVSHARPGRLALFLEGGYHLGALGSSVNDALVAALGGTVHREKPSSGGPGLAEVLDAQMERRFALDALGTTGVG